MLSIQAFSRLHFGVLRLSREMASAEETTSSRWFGGVGLMIEQPRLQLRLTPSTTWSAEGPLAARALSLAQHFLQITHQEENREDLPPCSLSLEGDFAEHAGLGSGTQLALALARALVLYWSLPDDLTTLARRMRRGQRSALGVHGFEQGGLLVEGGKRAPERLAPLVARVNFPEVWRLVVVLPSACRAKEGLHGPAEADAFAQLAAAAGTDQQTDVLCRLVLLGLLPAAVERDVDAFGEALYEFNRRVGETFVVVQGGSYVSPRVAELVAYVRSLGIRGVGQSSWGPAVFAVVADGDQAEHLANRLRQRSAPNETRIVVTRASNRGAQIIRDEFRSDG